MDFQNEQPISLSEALTVEPLATVHPNLSTTTVAKWCKAGLRSVAGRVVRLEARKLGGRWATSRQAVERFLNALNAG